jgi:chromosome segregation protein
MKLEKIKLSGFKSFVEQTVIPIHGNLTGIVGPNGCGKSNIIDAVRWVMGETSAKHLRGGNMADVIFNGSVTRKPVSVATVELVFDNSDGKVGGEYSQYAKLAIKRQVSRDGLSLYMLNGSRCRRKDITDLFLGTGLGSRSYAIIEQGTISRMVEAKPDELRLHIEEAAGVSKYKERRQETENRMSSTRENLARLNDLREEVASQLKHLHKQAQKAEKYSELKKQQRQVKLELFAMRWQAHQQLAEQLESKLQTIAHEHNRLFELQKKTEQNLENQRIEQKTVQQQLEVTQADYYHSSNEITRLEQLITHHEQSQQQTGLAISRLQHQLETTTNEYQQELQVLEELKQSQIEAEQNLLLSEQKQQEALAAQQQGQQQRTLWQQQWDEYRITSLQYQQQIQVQQAKTSQLELHNQQLQTRLAKLQQEFAQLFATEIQSDLDELKQSLELIEQQRDEISLQLAQHQQHSLQQRQQAKQHHQQLHELRSQLQHSSGKITSLELLQQHAMGKDKKALNAWLTQHELMDKPRLAEFLQVETGWEWAVECVLAHYLEAICLEQMDAILTELSSLAIQSLVLFKTRPTVKQNIDLFVSRLIDKVVAPWNLTSLLDGVYCVESLVDAQPVRKQLKARESVMTRDGVWLGSDWVKIFAKQDAYSGILQREKQLRDFKQQKSGLELSISATEQQLERVEMASKNLELTIAQLQQQDKTLTVEFSSKNAQLSATQTRIEQKSHRLNQLTQEIAELEYNLADNAELVVMAQDLKQQALQQVESLATQKLILEQADSKLQQQQYMLDQVVNQARQHYHSIQSRLEVLRSTEKTTGKQLERLQQQQQQYAIELNQLEQKQQTALTPIEEEKQALQQVQAQKQVIEHQLTQQRLAQQQSETATSQLVQTLNQTQQAIEKQKQALDQIRFAQQENQVRQQTITEQLEEHTAEPDTILKNLIADANEIEWKKQLDEVNLLVERLGTINLTAIDEYKIQQERASFLDTQYQDLTEALTTLELAIAKIDKETRLRFKETFDKINTGLQTKFPKLFGGGQAYLELTEQNILESGVTIIARPPGKKNSSIHLLSGGEKALTAVALVFSIFELNPAPFCLLDEVDAPLDDANVGRFSTMVAEMSQSVQFLFISHNKVTMEIAQQLIGVTMKEAGVSRMVAVNIEDAVQLAETHG